MEQPVFFDTSDGQKLRFNGISSYLKTRFGEKIVKLSVDGGFTCPNRDGSKGHGGCAFCSASGSGDMASGSGDIHADLSSQMELLSSKWPSAKYMAYFQSHTNTYAPVSELRTKFESALTQPGVVGIAIATRPDCITDEVLNYLCELNERTFMWVELGLQTIHSQTQRSMNLCYGTNDYDETFSRLTAAGIRVVTHLILGLPGETRTEMAESVQHVCANAPFGLKLHMFNLVKGSPLSHICPDYVPFSSIGEYTDLVIDMLEMVPKQVTIHRISGDAPRATLIAPEWSYRKRTILNNIHHRMEERNTWQGRLVQKRLAEAAGDNESRLKTED
ncbi:MAG: TIGR01212 family radical SAM protein [Firmicutes bacterium]|nr:TIGR01212 family radical SAM protein [Bacillota bacterium]